MFVCKSKKIILGIATTITRKSIYPIPWNGGPEQRPDDYYEQMITVLRFSYQEKAIKLVIPKVTKDNNRKRLLQVSVDGNDSFPFSSEERDVLNMEKTFELVEMEKLNTIVEDRIKNTKNYRRALVPFLYLSRANYTPPVHKQERITPNAGLPITNGDISKLVSPYLSAIQKKQHQGKTKELYIPVATLGNPHHWLLCVLSIDIHDNAFLTYLDSQTLGDDLLTYNGYRYLFMSSVVPGINAALSENGFKTVNENDVLYDVVKQFSYRGCGINASLSAERLGTGFSQVNYYGPKLNSFADLQKKDYASISIEEDAIRRVQLALKLHDHNKFIKQSKSRVMIKQKNHLEIVLRELKTHPHTLKIKANEIFANKNDPFWLGQERQFQQLLSVLKKNSLNNTWGGIFDSPQYSAVRTVVLRLQARLSDISDAFFNDPNTSQFELFKQDCEQAIKDARTAFKQIEPNIIPVRLELTKLRDIRSIFDIPSTLLRSITTMQGNPYSFFGAHAYYKSVKALQSFKSALNEPLDINYPAELSCLLSI